ncbi:hypothetical protein K461DRAFT_293809 [Myriangium duriaei CBS 260.36]|uniref:Chromatin assembly factor 1 subunit A n=1 Tax=Myriangium duriaei CBS 260.36 TaxID=1168546 RepID=A0A9P4MHV8_9PEZI|nr:hypothetical protein K461DRAFT_293809 [Myriangium duriaei CBS 260.36]
MSSTANPLKRSLDHTIQAFEPFTQPHDIPTPPNTTSPDEKPRASSVTFERASSPALSTSTLSSLPGSTLGSTSGAQPGTGTSSGPPAKRRKLTLAEKEQRRLGKEVRAREREAKRVQKEAENAVKEEERRVKAEKKRQEAEVKEEKQRIKDLAKRQKEEEEAKKQRAQSRLGSFFTKATPTKSSNATPAKEHGGAEQLSTTDLAQASPSKRSSEPIQAQHTDYHNYFLPFSLPSHTTLATDLYRVPTAGDESAQQRFDNVIFSQGSQTCHIEPIQKVLGLAAPQRRGRLPMRASKVIERLQGSPHHPIDLTTDHSFDRLSDPAADLAAIDIKHLHFCQDERPPWTGSCTRVDDPSKATKVARNPAFQVREDTNYEYDSELEWEEPEEGEDLLSDGEDDAESVGSADEMDGFLDDGDVEEAKAARRLITSELEPISSGLCWQSHSSPQSQQDATPNAFDLSNMRLQWLIDSDAKSINPFSDEYWQVKSAPAPALPPQTDLFGRPITSSAGSTASLMKPPRLPLQPASDGGNHKVIVNAKSGEKGPIMAISAAKSAKAPARKLTGEDFDLFKDAVVGSNATKVDLLKALKQRFPKFTNDSIKETLTSHFARHGSTNAEKIWKLVTN